MDVDDDSEHVGSPPSSGGGPSVSETNNNLPWEDLRKYFVCSQQVTKLTKNLSVVCLKCRKTLSTAKSTASNLKKHLEGSHKAGYESYLKEKQKRPSEAVEANTKRQKLGGELRQLEIRDFLSDRDRKAELVNQKRVDSVVVDLIVNEGLPFGLVNSPYFKSCVLLGLPSQLNVMSHKKLGTLLENKYAEMKLALKEMLAEAQYVSTTADCWTTFRRSYLGMTVHWINQDSLERKSAALALRRIYGSHTYDKLAEEMNNVHHEFHIQNKVLKISTDNGSNFCKAFREYCEREDAAENTEKEDVDEERVYITDILNAPDEETQISLPTQQRCAAHTLNLIAVNDAKKALNDPKYRRHHGSACGKLKNIWTRQSKSTLVADAIHKLCGVYLKIPGPTRWNAFFDAVFHALELKRKRSNDDESPLTKAFDVAGLDRLSEKDLDFLAEYVAVNAPLAKSLDILQGDKQMFLGFLLPTLTQLRTEMEELKSKGLVYCQPLVEAFLNGLNCRFEKEFNDPNNIIAAGSLPQFQFDWIASEEERAASQDLVLKALEDETEKMSTVVEDSAAPSTSRANSQATGRTTDDNTTGGSEFFKFKQRRGAPMKPSDVARDELRRYQSSADTSVQSLQNFPLMKKVFCKFNTPLSSSGSIERFLSTSGNVCTVRRGKLADRSLEIQVLLKANQKTIN